MSKVLVIDDEIQFIDSISPFLEMENHQVFSAMTAHQGLSLLEKESPAVILLDVKLPGQKSGLDLIQCIRNIDKNIPIIMVSGMAQTATIVKAIKAGAADYLQKPFDADLLLEKVADVLSSTSMRAANDETLPAKNESATLHDPAPDLSQAAPNVSVSEIEQKALVKALEEAGGNISKAAKVLGLSRDTIYRRMRKYGIPIKKAFLQPPT